MLTWTALAIFVAFSAAAFDAGVMTLGDDACDDILLDGRAATLLGAGSDEGRWPAGRFFLGERFLEGELRPAEGGAMVPLGGNKASPSHQAQEPNLDAARKKRG
jgi:hypothetical protein